MRSGYCEGVEQVELLSLVSKNFRGLKVLMMSVSVQ